MDYRPDFITSTDYPWLDRLLDLYKNLEGHRIYLVDTQMPLMELPRKVQNKYKRARKYLDRLWSARDHSHLAKEIRSVFFKNIFEHPHFPSSLEKSKIIANTCKNAAITDLSNFERLILSDITQEQFLSNDIQRPSAQECALEINLNFAKQLLFQAIEVEIKLPGDARRVVQIAKLKGLLCNANRVGQTTLLQFSGPLTLHGKTKYYGKAFASILSVLPWCKSYELTALCEKLGERYTLKLTSNDPIKPATMPRKFDSSIEERFAKDFAKKAIDWTLTREPGPIETSDGILFPDFMVHHKFISSRCFYVEIVAWWTPEYLERKLKLWGLVENTPFVLCICEKIAKNTEEIKVPNGKVLYFKNKVDVTEVLSVCLEFTI